MCCQQITITTRVATHVYLRMVKVYYYIAAVAFPAEFVLQGIDADGSWSQSWSQSTGLYPALVL